MRYVATALLFLGLGITAMAPVASAQVNIPQNNTSTNLPTPPGLGGNVGGGNTVCPVIGPCYEPR